MEINKYKIEYRNMPIEVIRSEELDETRDASGQVIARIDYKNMSKETALALKQYDINNELNQKEFIQTNPNSTSNPFVDNANDFNSLDANLQNMNQSKQNEVTKTLTLTNGHSILGNNNDIPNGFSSRLLIALLSGFGLGVVAATIYIFTNLSKVVYYIK